MTPPEPSREARPATVPLRIQRPGDSVPAIVWQPARPAGHRPLVLLGHGAGQSKEAPFITRLGHWLASGPGYTVLAIDLPYHGERTPAEEAGLSPLQRRRRMGLDAWRERNTRAAGQAVADWKAAIAAVDALEAVRHEPIGYAGLSMGTRSGVPLAAAEPRITAAVFGLFGHPAADTESDFARAARQITIPILYLQQWDDELFPRDDGLALFDLFGSRDKTMHANTGGHLETPRAELGSIVQFLSQHLNGSSKVTLA